MTVPTVPTYSAQALIDAQQALLDLIDVDAAAAKFKIRDSLDVLLGEITLDDPAGTIDVAGQMTLTSTGADLATGNGTAAYAELTDGADVVHLSIPVSEGVAALTGFIVLNSLTIIAGQPITLLSATIG